MANPLKAAGETMMRLFEICSPECFLTILVIISAVFIICREKGGISDLIKLLVFYAILAGLLMLLGHILPTVVQWILIAFWAFCAYKYATAK